MKRSIILSLALAALCPVFALAQEFIPSQWQGRRVAFLGDSITDQRQIGSTNNIYWNDLQKILGIEPYVYGISGHRMNQIIGQAEKLEAEHGQDVDAIIVFIGTNDYNGSIPMGEWYTLSEQTTIDDGPREVVRLHREFNYDMDTFKGRANSVMLHLKTHYPDKQIIFMTPIHRGYARFSDKNIQPPESFANEFGLFIDDYVQAIREMSSIWSVPLIDLYSDSGLYPVLDEHTRYFRKADTDRLHPNTSGQLRMAYTIAYKLLTLPAYFPKYIALSFDDGPSETTEKILDVLEDNSVRASFFVMGKNIDRKGETILSRAVSLGCDLENHSTSHKHMSTLGKEEILSEIETTSDKIEKISGTRPLFFRPPYIDHNPLMHENIEQVFISGRSCQDWKKEVSAEQRLETLLGTVQDGDIILLHDFGGNDATVEALQKFIPAMKARGFEFVTVPELFERRGYIPAAHNGKVYRNVYEIQ